MNLSTLEGRKELINKIESTANIGRKSESYKASEVLNDRLKPYVVEELREQFSEETVREVPLVSSSNIAKRVVNQLACIYKDAPKREFTELSEDQEESVRLVYRDMDINKKLNYANKFYVNHDQCLMQIIPKGGKLIARLYKPHQWDVITDPSDPEMSLGYIISSYDNYYELHEDALDPNSATGRQTLYAQSNDIYKQELAFTKNAKQKNKRYLVWTLEENFVMDAKGNIVTESLPNPLAEFNMMPFVEVHGMKEFEYWVRTESVYANFSIEFNAALSSLNQVIKMQNFSVAILKGPQELLMESVTIGPNKLLKLPYDPQAGVDVDFQFATPSTDIQGSIRFMEVLLTTFLSSHGIDPKTVTMNGDGETYNSGLERLLSLIEKMQASKEDYDVFEKFEDKVYRLIKAWLNVLRDADNLDDKYKAGLLPEESEVIVEYAKPELVMTDADELMNIEKEIELGISSPVRAIMMREKLDREQALEKYKEYEQERLGNVDGGSES